MRNLLGTELLFVLEELALVGEKFTYSTEITFMLEQFSKIKPEASFLFDAYLLCAFF